MKYIITRSEKKTTQAGKPYIKASLQDEQGQSIDNVSIWSDFPNFSGLTFGETVHGSVEVNARGYKNLKKAESPTRDIVRIHDPRADIIRLAQDRKNESIAYFNATNAAIELVSSMPGKLMTNVNRSVLKQEIDYWREWFLQEWKKHESQLPRFRTDMA